MYKLRDEGGSESTTAVLINQLMRVARCFPCLVRCSFRPIALLGLAWW